MCCDRYKNIINSQIEVWNVNFSPDGQHLVTTGEDDRTRLWDLSGEQICQFAHHRSTVIEAKFSPDGKILVTIAGDGIKFWNLSGKQIANRNIHPSWITKDYKFYSDRSQ